MREGGGRTFGRYTLADEIAAGGMGTVHFGRLVGPLGFSRTVAIKRLHPNFAKDIDFVTMFLDEARLAARISHPNVVATLDVVAEEGELLLVLEYVQGESLSRLAKAVLKAGARVPVPIAVAILAGTLHGLHAAHEATNEAGAPLGIVHRDVSPQNILVGADGVARLLDFGVAKAIGKAHTTRDGAIKGKLSYMAPEQLFGDVDRRTDVFAASVVLWELLTGRRLFDGDTEGTIASKVQSAPIAAPSHVADGSSSQLDAVVLRGLERDPSRRFSTARDMAIALEQCERPALATEVGEWVERVAGVTLRMRADKVGAIESRPGGGGGGSPPASTPAVLTPARGEAVTSIARPLADTRVAGRGSPGRSSFVVPFALGVGLVVLVGSVAAVYVARAAPAAVPDARSTAAPPGLATDATAAPSTLPAAPASPPDGPGPASPPGFGPIQGLGSWCLTAKVNDGANTWVGIRTCTGSPLQDWSFRHGQIASREGDCLTAGPMHGTRIPRVGLSTCTGGANQRWVARGQELVGLGGSCMTVGRDGLSAASWIVLWACGDGPSGQWTIRSSTP